MTVNSYLQNRASSLVIHETEKEKIQKSVNAIKSRLSSYFWERLVGCPAFRVVHEGDDSSSFG